MIVQCNCFSKNSLCLLQVSRIKNARTARKSWCVPFFRGPLEFQDMFVCLYVCVSTKLNKLNKGYIHLTELCTLSPIVMVQWKITLNDLSTNIGRNHFPLNHDYGRKGTPFKPQHKYMQNSTSVQQILQPRHNAQKIAAWRNSETSIDRFSH